MSFIMFYFVLLTWDIYKILPVIYMICYIFSKHLVIGFGKTCMANVILQVVIRYNHIIYEYIIDIKSLAWEAPILHGIYNVVYTL